MSIEMYKQLNEELVNTVQELKAMVTRLETEVITSNGKIFAEQEKRVQIEQKCRRAISKLNKTVSQAFNIATTALYDDIFSRASTERAQRLTENAGFIRRSSMGVTMRSPLRTVSPMDSVANSDQQQHKTPDTIAEEVASARHDDESSTNVGSRNLWGLSNLQERSDNTRQIISKENTPNASDSSSCQSVTSNEEITNVPNIVINQSPCRNRNRRATQVFNYNTTSANHRSPNYGVAVANDENNSNYLAVKDTQTNASSKDNSKGNSLDSLAVDFSQNFCLHSTPRSSQALSPSNAPNTSDDSCTLTQSHLQRPRRKCAPKVLTEPRLLGKLRNEEAKCETKKKKKTNKSKK